jgi:ribosome maturation factor RimP
LRVGPPGTRSFLLAGGMNADPGAPNAPVPDGLDEARLIVESGLGRRIAEIVTPPVRDLGYRVVRVKLSTATAPVLQIMLERADGSMSVEDCEVASTEISPHLDLADLISSAYRLEVSSPGIDRLLVRESDFRRAVSHEARIELSRPLDGRKRFRGIIEAVEIVDGALVVDLRLGDGSEPQEIVARLAVADMVEARLVLTDALVRAALRREKTVIRSQKSEIRKQKSEIRKQKSPGRKQKSDSGAPS